MRSFLLAIFIGFSLSTSVSGQFGNNPFEPIIRDHTAKSQKLLEEIESRVKKLRQNFVTSVAKHVEVLNDEGNTAAAKALSDFLTKVEAAPNAIASADVITGELLPLHTGAHKFVIEFLDEALLVDKEFALKIERLKQAAIKAMKQQVPKGQRVAPDMANRTQKFMSDFISSTNPKFDGVVPTLPEDDFEAELIYKRTGLEFQMAVKRDILKQTNQLFVDLYTLRLNAAESTNEVVLKQLEKIDLAFRTERSIEEQFAQARKASKGEIKGTPIHQDPSGWVMTNLDAIDDTIEPALMEHVKQCKSIRDRHGVSFAKLDSLWAGRNSKELKKILLSDAPLDRQVNEVSRHMRLIRESHPWLTLSYTQTLPGVEPSILEVLEDLEESGHARVMEADRQDAELRNVLIAKLKEIPDADAIEESGKLDVIASLTSDYGEGIRGTLVFDVDPRLNMEAKKLLDQYLDKAEQLRDKIFSDHKSKVAECRVKLKPKRTSLIQKNDFLGAILIDLHLARRTYPVKPIWIRFNNATITFSKSASYETSAPVLLLARNRKKGFLVFAAGDRWDWLSRDKIALSYSEYSKSEAEIGKSKIWTNEYRFNPKDPSSKPLEVGMRLKKGDQLLVPVANGWHEKKVEDLSPFGVVIHVSDFGLGPQIDIFPRGIVRWINEQKVE